MSSIVQVETNNGTEFVNLDMVRRFVPGADDSLELRFGQAETLVLTDNSAQRVLAWVTAQAQAFRQQTVVPSRTLQKVAPVSPQPVSKPQPQRRLQLMPLNTVHLSVMPIPTPPTTPSLDSMAASASPARLPSPAINRQRWLP